MNTLGFQRLLIANRGEIAIRIARAASELGIQTVGIFSYEDRFSLHRYKTDESYQIGTKGSPLSAYLDMESIIHIAKIVKIDAIHPGYGFLSESFEFAQLCRENGITFIGPSVEVLKAFGDKVKARHMASKAGLNLIPGTLSPIASLNEALSIARDIGFPITLKAVTGGGGKGIRMIKTEQELAHEFSRAKSEAKSNFGKDSIYLEKTIEQPKHVEVQILADTFGNIVHLFERDCSIQRRNQKVVEVAPAYGISHAVKESIYTQSVKIAKAVNYVGVGTVEFLVDQEGEAYFLEVNPRIQVEHTVTEMITGIDLMQASICVAAQVPLNHSLIGIKDQEHIELRGCAIQCRVTTEDPQNDFAPDVGRIIAYRPAAGFGIRLDEGHGTTGGNITPHYDSLLVKVTAWSHTIEAAAAKMFRSLSEFRIRGVKHNIPILKNIVQHPNFLQSHYDTKFFDTHKELFVYPQPRDRATKLLEYIAQVTINDPHELKGYERRGSIQNNSYDRNICTFPSDEKPSLNAKAVFDREGATGLVNWIKSKPRGLLTDTTMRDAQQSLFATRMRTTDMIQIAPYYNSHATNFFSLEVWGGATFDTSLRYLREDPWNRLEKLREVIPNILFQMLLRGDNAVGYKNYPKKVIQDFIAEAAKSGIDVFRIFDCFNQPSKMATAIEEVKRCAAVAEVTICYTGDLTCPSNTKYTLNYYISLAKQLENMGGDLICIKDMAGLLKPKAASILIKALREETALPIHLHTHDTAGSGIAMLIEAINSGCHIVDGAVSSMSGLTSQPSLNALVASLEPNSDCFVPLKVLDELSRYWDGVRSMYHAFDPGIRATSTEVYQHEIPGGQYSNFYEQAKKIGLTPYEFNELTTCYSGVNRILGDIIKVTPSSKAVGDLALLLHKHKISPERLMETRPQLDYPDSIRRLVAGELGEPLGSIPIEVKKVILGNNPVQDTEKKPENNEDIYEQANSILKKTLNRSPNKKEILSYSLYPKIYLDFLAHCRKYGEVTSQLSTPVFFFGLKESEEIEVHLEAGKTLFIELKGTSKVNDNGQRTIFFSLNGFNRQIELQDLSSKSLPHERPKADPENPCHIPAPMPGKVAWIKVQPGDMVEKGDVMFITESMKMEYSVAARTSGVVEKVFINPGDEVNSADLLATLT